eukprot:TRINITY_DN10641_c0_g1_i10.p1 TRINITY_DN10641_c0_g1~~TRINITY_DN10641_c0_g1_i10.p1  ORF type:complete len:150 (+),score=34.24 TRINITY_DN10641_c0_g1_i10:194-643(+)
MLIIICDTSGINTLKDSKMKFLKLHRSRLKYGETRGEAEKAKAESRACHRESDFGTISEIPSLESDSADVLESLQAQPSNTLVEYMSSVDSFFEDSIKNTGSNCPYETLDDIELEIDGNRYCLYKGIMLTYEKAREIFYDLQHKTIRKG